MTKANLSALSLSIVLVLLLSACTQKTKIHLLQPARIDTKAKNIAVLPFQQDAQIGLSGKIESQLTQVLFNGQSYFNLVDRLILNKVIKEQKRQQNGLFDEQKAAEMGVLLGADALISGAIVSLDMTKTRSREQRKECRKKKCKKREDYTYYKVSCVTSQVDLSVNIRMTQVSSARVLYSKNLQDARAYKNCKDQAPISISKRIEAQAMAEKMAALFVRKLVPYYTDSEVVLLDDEDLEFTDHEQSLLKNALLFIQQDRLDKAEQLLSDLVRSTRNQSYVAAYNLGVVKEAQGELEQARDYYLLADSLQVEPVKAINAAINRINSSKVSNIKAKKQLQRNLAY